VSVKATIVGEDRFHWRLLNLGVQSEVVEEVGITIWWQSGLSSQYDSVARVLSVSHGIKIPVAVRDDKGC